MVLARCRRAMTNQSVVGSPACAGVTSKGDPIGIALSKCHSDQDLASAASSPRAALKRSAGSGSGSLIRSLSDPSIE